jgi:hypothetical protein
VLGERVDPILAVLFAALCAVVGMVARHTPIKGQILDCFSLGRSLQLIAVRYRIAPLTMRYPRAVHVARLGSQLKGASCRPSSPIKLKEAAQSFTEELRFGNKMATVLHNDACEVFGFSAKRGSESISNSIESGNGHDRHRKFAAL